MLFIQQQPVVVDDFKPSFERYFIDHIIDLELNRTESHRSHTRSNQLSHFIGGLTFDATDLNSEADQFKEVVPVGFGHPNISGSRVSHSMPFTECELCAHEADLVQFDLPMEAT